MWTRGSIYGSMGRLVPLAGAQGREALPEAGTAEQWTEKQIKRKKGRLLLAQHLKQTKQALLSTLWTCICPACGPQLLLILIGKWLLKTIRNASLHFFFPLKKIRKNAITCLACCFYTFEFHNQHMCGWATMLSKQNNLINGDVTRRLSFKARTQKSHKKHLH